MRNQPFYRLLFVLMMVLAVFGSAAAQLDMLSDGNEEKPSALDLLKDRDKDLVVVQQDGVPTWISGNLTDIIVKDADRGWKAL